MTILASNLLLNQHLFSSTTAATVTTTTTTTTTTTVAAAAKIDYAKIFSIYSKKSQRGALSLSPSQWTQLIFVAKVWRMKSSGTRHCWVKTLFSATYRHKIMSNFSLLSAEAKNCFKAMFVWTQKQFALFFVVVFSGYCFDSVGSIWTHSWKHPTWPLCTHNGHCCYGSDPNFYFYCSANYVTF